MTYKELMVFSLVSGGIMSQISDANNINYLADKILKDTGMSPNNQLSIYAYTKERIGFE